MIRKTVYLTVALLCMAVAPAVAANSVSIKTQSVWDCAVNVRIGVRIANDVPLRELIVPLVIREYDPGSITALKLSFDQRLAGDVLSDVRVTNMYFSEDGNCKSGLPGGFGTVAHSDTLTHPVPSSPIGVLFHRATVGTDLLPVGEDLHGDHYSKGSLILTLTMDDLWSGLEIDTTCTDPASHLLFVDASSQPIGPVFYTSEVQVDYFCWNHGDLDLDGWITALDLGIEIDYLFAGGSITPHFGCDMIVDAGDFNCDGFPDVVDLAALIDHLFAGGQGPCDPVFDCAPCACWQEP